MTKLNTMARQWKREMDRAPICEPGPNEYVDACHWSRTGFAIWTLDGGCSCRPAIVVKPKISLQDALKISLKSLKEL